MPLEHLKSKSAKDQISALRDRLTTMKGTTSSDEKYWKLSVDAAGQGVAEIRLLPAMEGEDFPFVEIREYGIGVYHADIGKKKWYINRSLESIGQKDPVKDEFWALHRKGDEQHKEMAKIIRDRTAYIVWIYVINDKYAPENNGKVMKAKLSPSIWKFVTDKLTPQFDDDESVNVFDLWEGANLKIRAYNGENNMRTYDKTVWMPQGALFSDDEKLEEIYSQVKGLNNEVDPNNQHYKKSYAELETQLESVLGRSLVKNEGEQDHSKVLSNAFADSGMEYTAHQQPAVEEVGLKPTTDMDDDDEELRRLLNS